MYFMDKHEKPYKDSYHGNTEDIPGGWVLGSILNCIMIYCICLILEDNRSIVLWACVMSVCV